MNERQVRELCAERRIRIEAKGQSFRLRGPGVDFSVVQLSQIAERDLEPHQPRSRD